MVVFARDLFLVRSPRLSQRELGQGSCWYLADMFLSPFYYHSLRDRCSRISPFVFRKTSSPLRLPYVRAAHSFTHSYSVFGTIAIFLRISYLQLESGASLSTIDSGMPEVRTIYEIFVELLINIKYILKINIKVKCTKAPCILF